VILVTNHAVYVAGTLTVGIDEFAFESDDTLSNYRPLEDKKNELGMPPLVFIRRKYLVSVRVADFYIDSPSS